MNPIGATAAAVSVVAFLLTQNQLRARPRSVRLRWLGIFTVLSVPSLWFVVYYVHVLPETEWFYTLRSWRGSEFLMVFAGCSAGAAASILSKWFRALPLFALAALAFAPHMKPLIGPLSDAAFSERWQGDACLQSTSSTCGPASVATILRRLGVAATERAIARSAFTYAGGTEAWYLARYVRSRGLSARFDFQSTFSPGAGLPALVGVRLGGLGHFIAVLDIHDDQVTFADPLRGEERLSREDFQSRYDFTGFHLIIRRGKEW